MKIHNPNDLEFDPQTLRALARGDLDPVRQAVEDHRQEKESAAEKNNQGLAGGGSALAANTARSPNNRSQPPAKTGAISSRNGAVNNQQHSSSKPGPAVDKSPERRQAEYLELMEKRKQLTDIIRECEALEVVSFETLAMKHYPDGNALAAAGRRRDLWLLCCLFCVGITAVGWLGLLPPWSAGIAFGLLVLLLALMLAPFRKLIYQLPTLANLKSVRKSMEFQALNHIKMLEGGHGLVYQCQRMLDYRTSLGDKRFQRLVKLSRQKNLIKAIQTVAGIRLYLSYLLEAQQAFAIVKQEYMKTSTRMKREYADLTLENDQ